MLPEYAELHCLSNFSFLRGASHPEELVEQAALLGYCAIALTDRHSLAGVVRAHLAVRRHNEAHPDRPIRLIIGAEIHPEDAPPLVLLAPHRAAYGRLSRLLTRGKRRTRKGDCRLFLSDVAELGSGMIAIIPGETGIRKLADPRIENHAERASPLNPLILPSLGPAAARSLDSLSAYRSIFGDGDLYLAADLRFDLPDAGRLEMLGELSRRSGIPLVACNAVHYHVPQRRYLQDVLTCIREKCTIHEAGTRLLANAERHLRPREEIARRYAGHEALLDRTVAIAARCAFSLDELRYEYPAELVPDGRSAMDYLRELTWRGAAERYGGKEGPAATIPPRVAQLLRAELALIAELRYEHYFLTVHDLARYARSRGILCQGRGSAANSAVCYCLGVTAVDPARIDLLFERFISRERNEPPDIDIDFEHERREEVFRYIYQKYGRERAALTAEVISYRPRSAVRDVGKALGLNPAQVDALSRSLDWWGREAVPQEALRAAGLDPDDRTVQMVVRLVRQLLGFPRHLSQHVGGFVITQSPLCEIVPLENGAMPGRTFIEWNKDDIDALGILKVDCLALGMLTAIRKCFAMLKGAIPPSLTAIPPEDPHVYDMICAADTMGVFQIESRAQMSMLPRLRPRNFYDLVIEVAIVRPGPIQGGMVHPYLRRRSGQEPVSYASQAVRQVLAKTLGVPLFQEQVMRLAVVAAGFTPGEADQLRRAMAAWRRSGEIDKFQVRLVRGMLENGYSREFAEQIYRQIQGFGEYGFPESHAASFALLVYASAWLKRYYPAAFCGAIINSQPMGFYTPAQLIRDAIAHGVTVLPVDVNTSEWDCTLEESRIENPRDHGMEKASKNASPRDSSIPRSSDAPALRLGFRLVRGLSESKMRGILAARREGPIRSIHQLARREDVTRDTLVRLAAADAFRSLGLSRREALWRILALDDADQPLLAELEPAEPPPPLPPMSIEETVVQDYGATGLSLNAHPIELVRAELERLRVSPNAKLRTIRNRQKVSVAGLVTCRQHPSTARGIVFITLEDESDNANLIVRPQVWERYKSIARLKLALIADGVVERQGDVVHVLVHRIRDLSALLGGLRHTSRDFR